MAVAGKIGSLLLLQVVMMLTSMFVVPVGQGVALVAGAPLVAWGAYGMSALERKVAPGWDVVVVLLCAASGVKWWLFARLTEGNVPAEARSISDLCNVLAGVATYGAVDILLRVDPEHDTDRTSH